MSDVDRLKAARETLNLADRSDHQDPTKQKFTMLGYLSVIANAAVSIAESLERIENGE